MSHKVTEQQRRATENTSPDIILELDMTVYTPQNRFLANRRNNARFIRHVMTKLENVGVVCSQSPADADHMSSNTALTAAKLLDKPVVLVGNYTDLLVMLIDKQFFFHGYIQAIYAPIAVQYFAFIRHTMQCMTTSGITSFLFTHFLDMIPFRHCT